MYFVIFFLLFIVYLYIVLCNVNVSVDCPGTTDVKLVFSLMSSCL